MSDLIGEVRAQLEHSKLNELLRFVLALTDEERVSLRPLAREWMRRAPPGRPMVRHYQPWSNEEFHQTYATLDLALCVLTWTDLSRLNRVAWERAYALEQIVPALRPPWFVHAVDLWLAPLPERFRFVWHWVQDGILPRPTSEVWIRSGVWAPKHTTILERLRADLEVELAESLRRLMLTSGPLSHGTDWQTAISTLADEGKADRHLFLGTALASMLRELASTEMAFLLGLARALIRGDDDRAQHKPALLALLGASEVRARGFGVEQLTLLHARAPLGSDVLYALPPALIMPQKGIARAAAALMTAIASQPGVDPDALAEALAAAAMSPVPEVRRAAETLAPRPPATAPPSAAWTPATPVDRDRMLDEALRVAPITTPDELVAVWTQVVERGDPEQAERVLDAALRLAARRRDPALQQLAGPLVQQCRKRCLRPTSDTLPYRYPFAAFALWWFAEEACPWPEWATPSAEQAARPFDALRFLDEGPLDPFLASRFRAAKAAVESGEGRGCLGLPTHRGARVAAEDAVHRVAAWEAAGAEPPEVEVVLMLSRLAPVGRARAVEAATLLTSPVGRALQAALGIAASLDGLSPAVRFAAARCAGTRVVDLMTEHPEPDASCPANAAFLVLSAAPFLRIEVSSDAPWSPDRRWRRPRNDAPPPVDPDGSIAKVPLFGLAADDQPQRLRAEEAHHLAANLWKTGWMACGRFAWPDQTGDIAPYRVWATLRSQDLEPFFAVGAVRLAAGSAGQQVMRANAAFLEPLLDPFVPLGACALWALTVGLGCRPPELRLLAIDALRVVADDGRLTLEHVDGIGARIAALWGVMHAPRFSASLIDVGGPLGLAVLEAALRHSEGPAKGWSDVLEAWGALLDGTNGDAELCARMGAWKLPGPAKKALARIAAG